MLFCTIIAAQVCMSADTSLFVREMQSRGLRMALAESVTCGMAAHLLATAKGTSDVFVGSVVCYSPEVKINLLGVQKKTVEKYSCESAQCTEELVKGLKKNFSADVYAALTGLAAAGGSETKNKPVGTVFFCVSYKRRLFHSRKVFKGSPLEIRKKSCLEMYSFILSIIKNDGVK